MSGETFVFYIRLAKLTLKISTVFQGGRDFFLILWNGSLSIGFHFLIINLQPRLFC